MANKLDQTIRIYKATQLEGVDIQPLFEAPKVAQNAAGIDAETIRAAAFEQGLYDAQKEATELLLQARREYENARTEAEDDAVDFAFALAARIVGDEIVRHPDRIVTIISSLLGEVRDRRELVIYVHPDDFAAATAGHSTFEKDGVPVMLESRDGISRGGCVIETAVGRIDGRIETQLRIFREATEGK